jgi:hypothetical protein
MKNYSINRFVIKEITFERIFKSIKVRFENIYYYLKFSFIKNKKDIKHHKINSHEALLIANGPSLKNTDLTKYDNYDWYGMNRVYIEKNILEKLKGLFVVNKLVVEQFSDDFNKLDLSLFTQYKYHRFFNKDVFFTVRKPFSSTFGGKLFSDINPGSTVTFYGLQVLFHLGYKKVTLIGLDHNFGEQQKINHTEKVVLDTFHFSKNYFPKGVKWETPDLISSEYQYAVAKLNYESCGRKIIDSTINGKCTIFEKSTN